MNITSLLRWKHNRNETIFLAFQVKYIKKRKNRYFYPNYGLDKRYGKYQVRDTARRRTKGG